MNNKQPELYHGRPHSRCGTTLKYRTTGNCYHCFKNRKRSILTDEERIARLDAQLLEFPRRPVRINRPCRITLIVEIPAPPITLVNQRWAA